jgi:hypothetical protein
LTAGGNEIKVRFQGWPDPKFHETLPPARLFVFDQQFVRTPHVPTPQYSKVLSSAWVDSQNKIAELENQAIALEAQAAAHDTQVAALQQQLDAVRATSVGADYFVSRLAQEAISMVKPFSAARGRAEAGGRHTATVEVPSKLAPAVQDAIRAQTGVALAVTRGVLGASFNEVEVLEPLLGAVEDVAWHTQVSLGNTVYVQTQRVGDATKTKTEPVRLRLKELRNRAGVHELSVSFRLAATNASNQQLQVARDQAAAAQVAVAAMPAATNVVARHLAARASTAVAQQINTPAQSAVMRQLLAEGGD